MIYRTLKDWNAQGRLVKKGSIAAGHTRKGKALFTKKQTKKIPESYFEDYGNFSNINNQNFFGDDNPD